MPLVSEILRYIQVAAYQEHLRIALELLVIGFIVYWALSFLEGTRGERLFRGAIFILIFVSVILRVAIDYLDLQRLDEIYDVVAVATLVIIAIAFQPEIRRALIRIGQAGFLSSSPQQLSKSVEEIVKAVTQMASIKVGAIIVIEQQVGLGEFIDSGVKIDSKVTADLLKTIFYPGTPLHDMGVVIQGDRIIAARVQLPLAESSPTMGQLGSRHRAAIGVTTSSDAIVIVVSEETGIISVAMNGNLIRNISEEQVRRYLTTAVVETTPLVERMKETQEIKQPKIDDEK
jgi:diadenylate cyclase